MRPKRWEKVLEINKHLFLFLLECLEYKYAIYWIHSIEIGIHYPSIQFIFYLYAIYESSY